MAVLQSIWSLFSPATVEEFEPEFVVPAPPTTYSIHPLTDKHAKEVLRLNLRCFRNGENYTKHTFAYLLNEPKALAYRIVTEADEMAGFVFAILNNEGSAHLTTIGVAPEHRRRGLAEQLLSHLESVLAAKHVGTVVLEVRVGNISAQQLYRHAGYSTVQRITNYYSNGEDCFMMMKSVV